MLFQRVANEQLVISIGAANSVSICVIELQSVFSVDEAHIFLI